MILWKWFEAPRPRFEILLRQVHSLISCLQKQSRFASRRFNLCPCVVAHVWSPSTPFWPMRTTWLKTIGGAIDVCWPHALQKVKWTFAVVGWSSTWELGTSWVAQLCCSTSLQWRTLHGRTVKVHYIRVATIIMIYREYGAMNVAYQQWMSYNCITACKFTHNGLTVGSGVIPGIHGYSKY